MSIVVPFLTVLGAKNIEIIERADSERGRWLILRVTGDGLNDLVNLQISGLPEATMDRLLGLAGSKLIEFPPLRVVQ